MKKVLFLSTIIMFLSSLSAMQSPRTEHDNNKVLCCALCREPIEQGGCCAKFLNKLFCRMTSVHCPIPDCVVICHPSCLQQHVEKIHHQDDSNIATCNPCDVALNVLEGCACLAFAVATIAAGCIGIGVLTYPLYAGGRMMFGSWFDAPFVVFLGYELSDSMADATDPRLRAFARIAGALWGVSAGAFDIWLYNARNSV